MVIEIKTNNENVCDMYGSCVTYQKQQKIKKSSLVYHFQKFSNNVCKNKCIIYNIRRYTKKLYTLFQNNCFWSCGDTFFEKRGKNQLTHKPHILTYRTKIRKKILKSYRSYFWLNNSSDFIKQPDFFNFYQSREGFTAAQDNIITSCCPVASYRGILGRRQDREATTDTLNDICGNSAIEFFGQVWGRNVVTQGSGKGQDLVTFPLCKRADFMLVE